MVNFRYLPFFRGTEKYSFVYLLWLSFVKSNYKPYSPAENFLFINAWNEWGEGMYLQGDAKYKNQKLEIVKKVVIAK